MRNTLALKYMLALACAVAAVSAADAGERLIRPRRVNRSASRTFAPGVWRQTPPPRPQEAHTPAAQPPQEHDPAPSPIPPEGVRLVPSDMLGEFGGEHGSPEVNVPSENLSNVTASYQETEENPPETPPVSPAPEEKEPPQETPEPEEKQEVIEEPEEVAIIAATPELPPEPEPSGEINAAPPLLYADGANEPRPAPAPANPTPAEVEDYRRRLELRLLERYNNMPDYAGEIGKVSVVLSKPLEPSFDGTRLRAEFDQLVHDPWGRRIPALEKEYYVVTFGSGGARQVRSDPSIRVGLNLERQYSGAESSSDAEISEKIRSLPSDHAFRANPSVEVPKAKMPDWWRPEFSEDGY